MNVPRLSRYARPILASREGRCSLREQEAGVLALEALHRQTLPFILRRMKEDVLKVGYQCSQAVFVLHPPEMENPTAIFINFIELSKVSKVSIRNLDTYA